MPGEDSLPRIADFFVRA